MSKTPGVALCAEVRGRRGCPATARTWPLRRTSPTQPSSRPRTGSRPAASSVEPGPGRDLEAVVAQDPDGRRVGAQRPLRLVDDHRGTARRRSCEAASRPAMPRTVSRRSASSASSGGRPSIRRPVADRLDARGRRSAPTIRREDRLPAGPARRARPTRPPVVGAAVDGPLRSGRRSAVSGRARTSRSSHRGQRSRGRHRYHGSTPDHRTRSVDRLRAGLHSGGVATLRGPGRPIPLRGPHTPWTTVPVPSAPTAASSPGTRSVPPPDG